MFIELEDPFLRVVSVSDPDEFVMISSKVIEAEGCEKSIRKLPNVLVVLSLKSGFPGQSEALVLRQQELIHSLNVFLRLRNQPVRVIL